MDTALRLGGTTPSGSRARRHVSHSPSSLTFIAPGMSGVRCRALVLPLVALFLGLPQPANSAGHCTGPLRKSCLRKLNKCFNPGQAAARTTNTARSLATAASCAIAATARPSLPSVTRASSSPTPSSPARQPITSLVPTTSTAATPNAPPAPAFVSGSVSVTASR